MTARSSLSMRPTSTTTTAANAFSSSCSNPANATASSSTATSALPAPRGRSPPASPPPTHPAGSTSALVTASSPAVLRRAASLDWAGAWVEPEQRRRMMSLARPAGELDLVPALAAAGDAASGATTIAGARRLPAPGSTRLVRPVPRRASEDPYPRSESPPITPTSPHRLGPAASRAHRCTRVHPVKHANLRPHPASDKHAHHRPHPASDKRTHHRTSSVRAQSNSPMGGSLTAPSSATHRAHQNRRRSRRTSLERKTRAETQWARLRRHWAVVTVCMASLVWNLTLYRFAQAWKLDVRAASLPAAAAQGGHSPQQQAPIPSQAPLWMQTGRQDTPASSTVGGSSSPLVSSPSDDDYWSSPPPPSEDSKPPLRGSFASYMGTHPAASSEEMQYSSSFMPWPGSEEGVAVRKDTSTLWPDLLRIYALTGLACSIFGLIGVVRDEWRCFLVYVIQQAADFAIVVVDAIILAISLYHPAMQLYVCYLFSPSGSMPLGQEDAAPRARAPPPMMETSTTGLSLSPISSSSSSAFNLLTELTSLDYASAQCALRVRHNFIPPLWAAILLSSALRSLVLVHAVRYLRHARWRTKRRAAHAQSALMMPMEQSDILPLSISGAPARSARTDSPSPARSFMTVGSASPEPLLPRTMASQASVAATLGGRKHIERASHDLVASPVSLLPLGPLLGPAPSEPSHAPDLEAQLLELAWQEEER